MTLKDNAEELALIAQEIGAEVPRRPGHCPGRLEGYHGIEQEKLVGVGRSTT